MMTDQQAYDVDRMMAFAATAQQYPHLSATGLAETADIRFRQHRDLIYSVKVRGIEVTKILYPVTQKTTTHGQ
jgi:hypothetical protein